MGRNPSAHTPSTSTTTTLITPKSTTHVTTNGSSSDSLKYIPEGNLTSTPNPGLTSTMTTHDNSSSANATTVPSMGNEEGLSDGAVAVVIILVVLAICFVAAIVYLKLTGKMYHLLTCEVKVTKRRSSTSSSRRPLDVDDPDDEGRREDDLPVTREATMFTIDDFEPTVNDEHSTGNTEDYYYDEVFGQSMFEDEATNASMRQLYLVSEEEDEMFDVEIADFADTAPPTTTTTTTTAE